MQFQVGDNVRLKSDATVQSALGFQLRGVVMEIVGFESDTVAVCAYLQRKKAQRRSIPVNLLEHAAS
jgi:cysteine sulfinate desulfinase/cysteine desulfurase-like protein